MPPTPQYCRWPLLPDAGSAPQVWLKHENHTPVGAFKMRGGLVYFDQLMAARRRGPPAWSAPRAATTASRSPSRRAGTACRRPIVVPHGNSREKNAAMRALGAELIEHGDDFQAAREHAAGAGRRARLAHGAVVPSATWCAGVASYALELFDAVPDLDARVRADRPRLGHLRR